MLPQVQMTQSQRHGRVVVPQRTSAPRHIRPRWAAFACLLALVCLEGTGRKFLPMVPSTVFYFLKDAALVLGLVFLGISAEARRFTDRLMGPFSAVWVMGVVWTVVQCLNPDVRMFSISLVGLKAYWLWWLLPPLMFTYVRNLKDLQGIIGVFVALSGVIALMAAYQFSLPADDALNAYALYEGAEVNAVDTVHGTGRARVSSTFAYLSGFVAFVTLVPPLILAVGTVLPKGPLRTVVFMALGACVLTAPMSGSRSALVVPAAAMALVMFGAGLLNTRAGRRMTLAVGLSLVALPMVSGDALDGVLTRFSASTEETNSRFTEALTIFPPVAISFYDHDFMGSGTGTASNAASVLGVGARYYAEFEPARLLVELGTPGYLLVWTARLGLAVALLRLGRRFRAAHLRALTGACQAYAALVFVAPLYADHVYNALYFMGVGVLMACARVWCPATAPAQRAPAVRLPPRRTVPTRALPAHLVQRGRG